MKNLKSIMGILIISIITLGFNTNVKAEAVNFESTDLSDKLEVKSYIGDNTFSYETHFDNERNVTIVDITTTLDEATIASIFNHTPGNGNSPAQKGTVYFEIAPGVDGTNFKKDGTIITASDDLSTKKEEVTESIEEESNVNYSEVYVSQINIYYNNDGTFTALSGATTGGTTNEQALLTALNNKANSYTGLKYGEDYTFSANSTKSFLLAWKYNDTDTEKTEFIIVNLKAVFPVEIEENSGSNTIEHYFPTLKDALNSTLINNQKTININTNITLDEDLTIPTGVKVNVAKNNASVTVKTNKKLTINGEMNVDPEDLILETDADLDIGDDATIKDSTGSNNLHTITTTSLTNGEITTNPYLAKSGDTVRLRINPDEGYQLKEGSLKISTKSEYNNRAAGIALASTDITVRNNRFTMPDDDIIIEAEFEELIEEPNKLNITLVVKDETKENYSVEEGWTLQDLFNDLKASGLNITGFTDKDGNELSLDTTITNDMYLITVLVDTKIEEPPKTFDSLTTIIGIGVLSLGALGIAYKKYLVH